MDQNKTRAEVATEQKPFFPTSLSAPSIPLSAWHCQASHMPGYRGGAHEASLSLYPPPIHPNLTPPPKHLKTSTCLHSHCYHPPSPRCLRSLTTNHLAPDLFKRCNSDQAAPWPLLQVQRLWPLPPLQLPVSFNSSNAHFLQTQGL